MGVLNLIEYVDQSSRWFLYLNGSQFQKWDNLPDEIRSRLRHEHKFTTMIQGFWYTVKDYNGKWFVFRRNIITTTESPKKSYVYKSNRVPCLYVEWIRPRKDCGQGNQSYNGKRSTSKRTSNSGGIEN